MEEGKEELKGRIDETDPKTEPTPEPPKPATGSNEIAILNDKIDTLTSLLTNYFSAAPKTDPTPEPDKKQEPESDEITEDEINEADDLLDW